MKKIEKSISINATKEKVWETLWSSSTYGDWTNAIDEGMYMKGSLEEGKEIQFISSINGYGVTSLVDKLIPNEYILFKHKTDTKGNGLEKRKDEWTGGTESYSLVEKNGVTHMIVKMDVPIEMEELFNEQLPKALERIKKLSEQTVL